MSRTLRRKPVSRLGGLWAGVAALALSVGPAMAGVVPAGDYLAGLSARQSHDFARATEHFSRALAADPENPVLMEEVLRAALALGRFDLALPAAQQLDATGLHSQLATITLLVGMVGTGDWQAVLDAGGQDGPDIAPLLDGSIRAWALAGLGQTDIADQTLDQMARDRSLRAMALFQKALLRVVGGDLAGAEALFSGTEGPGLSLTRRGMLVRAEVLSQLGRNDAALEMLQATLGGTPDPATAALLRRLEAGETLPLTIVASARDALAEVFFTLGLMMSGEGPDAQVLAFSRTAEQLKPDHVDAILLSAAMLEQLEQFDLALAAYDLIPADGDDGYSAGLSRSQALRWSGRSQEAIAVLQDLTGRHPELPAAWSALGDTLHFDGSYPEAQAAYDRAIALSGDPRPSQWRIYFMRGMALERQDLWQAAESDLRMALQLQPDQPMVLNSLGYFLIDRKMHLDEALGMIRRAVAARPNEGASTDSLGWAFFRLGRYPEAVLVMERAATLMPVDPEVNDHLGDVYWAVGRKREAEFQWQRALWAENEDGVVDFDRIRRKLEIGLDRVLEAEGAPPLLPFRAAN